MAQNILARSLDQQYQVYYYNVQGIILGRLKPPRQHWKNPSAPTEHSVFNCFPAWPGNDALNGNLTATEQTTWLSFKKKLLSTHFEAPFGNAKRGTAPTHQLTTSAGRVRRRIKVSYTVVLEWKSRMDLELRCAQDLRHQMQHGSPEPNWSSFGPLPVKSDQ